MIRTCETWELASYKHPGIICAPVETWAAQWLILLALQLPEPHRRLQHALDSFPTTQTLFPTPLNHQENQP